MSEKWPSWLKVVVGGVGFMSDAYDLFVINLVKNVMDTIYKDRVEQPSSALATAALAGAVVGQLIFGSLADRLGRRVIFICTLSCIILGNILSALSFQRENFNIYIQLIVYQFILGFGIGGEYPLSATVSSENAQASNRGRSVALVFSMQGIGNLLSSVIIWVLLESGIDLDLVWRLALAFGAIPGMSTMYFRWKMQETTAFQRNAESERFADQHRPLLHEENSTDFIGPEALTVRPRKSECACMRGLRHTLSTIYEFRWLVAGTAISWFIFDYSYYAAGLFSGTIDSAVGIGNGTTGRHKLKELAAANIMIAGIGLPGYYVATALIDRVGRKRLQLFGFMAVTVVFTVMAVPLRWLEDDAVPFFVVLYGLTFFFANVGPNTTTFVIPSESFPTRARATCHGISAAAGKLGAVVGGATLEPLLHYGDDRTRSLSLVLYVCAAASLLGFTWTFFFTKDMSGVDLEAMENVDPSISAYSTKVNPVNLNEPLTPVVGDGNESVSAKISWGNGVER